MTTGAFLLRPLTGDEREALERLLNQTAHAMNCSRPIDLAILQSHYDALLQDLMDGLEDDLDPADTFLASLGLAYGETFLAGAGMDWARLEDQYGGETVVALVSDEISIQPTSMIEARLRKREPFDLAAHRYATIEAIRAIIASGPT